MGKKLSAVDNAAQVAALLAQLQELGTDASADVLAKLVSDTATVSAAQAKHGGKLKGKITKSAGKEKRETISAAILSHPTIATFVSESTARLDGIRAEYMTARAALDTALDALSKAQKVVDKLDLDVLTNKSTFTVDVLGKERVVSPAIQESADGTFYVGTGKSTQARIQLENSGTYHRIATMTVDGKKSTKAARMTVSTDGKSFFVDGAVNKSFSSVSSAARAAARTIGLADTQYNGYTFWKVCAGEKCTCAGLD